jgi:hypothetical protein
LKLIDYLIWFYVNAPLTILHARQCCIAGQCPLSTPSTDPILWLYSNSHDLLWHGVLHFVVILSRQYSLTLSTEVAFVWYAYNLPCPENCNKEWYFFFWKYNRHDNYVIRALRSKSKRLCLVNLCIISLFLSPALNHYTPAVFLLLCPLIIII